ncbi:Phospholipase_B [Hexamita inflata]|uniref:Phospholipase B-like n=1 Tax=Hexamita inflata TaxID=28002 RepID=A0AA86QVC0_9EUKA|nr:Phospholipase B [Hexamita inflata]
MLIIQYAYMTSDINMTQYFSISNDKISQQDKFGKEMHLQAQYNGDKTKTGFKELELTILSEKLSDKDQMKLIGYAEGILTADEIDYYQENSYPGMAFGQEQYPPVVFQTFVSDQLAYFKDEIEKSKNKEVNFETNFWKSVDLSLTWLEGLTQGYNKAKNSNKQMVDFYYLNSMMDYESLLDKFESKNVFSDQIPTHCSGIVYPTIDGKDIFFSHVSWNGFEMSFNRILKIYNLKLKLMTTDKQRIQFSSYPGLFFSLDDFYVIKNQKPNTTEQSLITVLETTYNNFKVENYALMTEKSTFTWMRAMLASLNTFVSQDWADFFTYNMSLTYNNNYLAVDYNLLEKVKHDCNNCSIKDLKQKLSQSKNLLLTIEIADKATQIWDATKQMYDQNYYISVNSPVSQIVHDFYGYTTDPYFDYNTSARLCTSKMVLGNQKISNFEEFKAFMRSNNFLDMTDECQDHDPREGISSRYDLCNYTTESRCIQQSGEVRKNKAFGAVDCKVTSSALLKEGKFEFTYGPTLGSGVDKFPKVYLERDWNLKLAGVQSVLPLTDNDVFYQFQSKYCMNRDHLCNKCLGDFEQKDGECVDINYTGIILALSIPLAILVIGLAVWAWFFFKKPKYEKVGVL